MGNLYLNSKKILSLFLALVLTSYYAPIFSTANAKDELKTLITEQNKSSVNVIPAKLEKEIKASLAKVYGQQNVDIIYANIERIALKTILTRPQNLKDEDLRRVDDWYKDEVIYMFYADQFGVRNSFTPNTFKDDIRMLDY